MTILLQPSLANYFSFSVGWAKFGKPVWSTRVIIDEMEPVWDETAFVLVGVNELNAEERLRVQLWE